MSCNACAAACRRRRQNRDPDPREPASAQLARKARQVAVLRSLNAHRDELRGRLIGDHPGTVIDLHQRTGLADAALREQHQPPAPLHVTNQRSDGEWVERIEAKHVHKRQNRARPPARGDARVNRKHRIAWKKRGQQRAVGKAEVVRHHHGVLAGRRVVLQPAHHDAVEQPGISAQQPPQNRRCQPPHVPHHRPLGSGQPSRPGTSDAPSPPDAGAGPFAVTTACSAARLIVS
jgi:hypothetical protein